MKAVLLLADGTVFKGNVRGKCKNSLGEVVFCTSMVGYQEMITDPAYRGQLVVMTFPLIGNYGVNKEDVLSDGIHPNAIIARDICDFPNNFRCEGTLEEFLIENNIVALEGIDTRALTRILRDKGTMNGQIIVGDYNEKEELEKINSYKILNPVSEVSVKNIKEIKCENAKTNVVVYDFGVTNDVLSALKARGMNITLVPYNTPAEKIKELNPDGIILSNGPGNPEDLSDTAKEIEKLVKMNIPVFGIELGHQVLALSLGGKCEKLKYGHRGSSQPVKDLKTQRTHITSQNHGYIVNADSIEAEASISHVNINDNTVEGLKYKNYPAFSVQFHPASEVGLDTSYLYDNFADLMEGKENA